MSQIRHTSADEPFFLIRTLGLQVATGRDTGRHTHDWSQLIYCSAGVMTVWTERGSWVAPPHWAIWVPAGVTHDIHFAGPAALRTLYLRADVASTVPHGCAVFTVSPLLRELILRAVDLRMLDERVLTHVRVAGLIVDEMARRDTPPFDLPAPVSEPARRAADLLSVGGANLGTKRLATRIGVSARTLERRFLRETGMSVAGWGRQARLLLSLRLLAAGEPVKSVSVAAGYRTPSAFVAAFRTAFGETPAKYFS